MSERQGGSYGLRKAAAPKKFDTDFEYYGAKVKLETPAPLSVKEERDKAREKLISLSKELNSSNESLESPQASPKRRYEVQMVEGDDPQVPDSPSKRPRGRPRKFPHPSDDAVIIPDESDANVDYVHLKSKRERRHMKEEASVEAVIESLEHGLGQQLMVEEVMITQAETHVVISAEPEDSSRSRLDELRRVRDVLEVEQAVISLPQTDEKENQPHQESDPVPEEAAEEILMFGIGSDEELADLTDVRVEIGTDGVEVPARKARRKYRKIKATAETLRHLKEFGADDKIECGECHKLLKPSSFRQHLKTHTGIKPFGCEVCEARFTRKGDVERHIRIVHNKQKPFTCHRCPRSFGDKKNLRWHLMNHDKKLFYVCETCGFKFGKKEYYENHVRFIHPMPEDESFVEEECSTLAETLLSTSMEVDGECSAGTDGFSYIPAGYVIKKGDNTISVLDPQETEEFEGETLEITESQLHSLLQQNTFGKRLTLVHPRGSKWMAPKKVAKPQQESRNSQVVSFKDLEKITNLSSEQLAKLHMTSQDVDSDGIEAVVIQIEQSSDQEADTELTVQEDDGQPVIIESYTDEAGTSTHQEVNIDSENYADSEPSASTHEPKEVNIVVSKSSLQESSEADANVQSLIDALLDAAKDSSQNTATSNT